MDDIVISAKDLKKQFKMSNGKINHAVDGISLEVKRGEIYGLIGPDGAGKTTLCRLLLGLMARTSGESSVFGYDSMKDTYQIRERIGYVAQQFTIPPDLTVEENMHFFADAETIAKNEQDARIKSLLEFTGLTGFEKRVTKRLSGGMKKKLALSCSLIHEPDLLVLDEPTLGVDPVSRREFWTLLSSLRAERGMTIFVCTPYMDEAERCSQIGLIYKGKIIMNDTPKAIKSQAPGELLEILPETGKFDAAMEAVQKMEGVREMQTYGAMLHVFVDNADQRKDAIQKQLTDQGIGVEKIRKINPGMEEVFISIVRKRQMVKEEK